MLDVSISVGNGTFGEKPTSATVGQFLMKHACLIEVLLALRLNRKCGLSPIEFAEVEGLRQLNTGV
jgi:hypothetical protein